VAATSDFVQILKGGISNLSEMQAARPVSHKSATISKSSAGAKRASYKATFEDLSVIVERIRDLALTEDRDSYYSISE
jgi:hypothetical protein